MLRGDSISRRSGCKRSGYLPLPALAACLLLAAGGAQASSTPDSRPAPATAAPPAAAAPAASADKSLPDERYISLGLKSGKTFARLAAPADASFFRKRSLSLGVRLPEALERFQASAALFELYLSAFAGKQVAGAELVELTGALLRNCVVLLEVVDELVPTISKDDPSYQERMAGLDQMRSGLAEVLSGAITSLTEEQYSVGARLRLVAYCRETFPSIVPRLTAPSRAEARQRLDALTQAR